jgi:predicted DNA-binding ribbon-helix-helix protein
MSKLISCGGKVDENSDQDQCRVYGLISRNISVLGRRTSVRLEPEMWQALKDVSVRERCSIHVLCSLIAQRKRVQSSLTAAVRVFVMLYYRAAATEEGHVCAGHGMIAQLAQRLPNRVHDRKSKAA